MTVSILFRGRCSRVGRMALWEGELKYLPRHGFDKISAILSAVNLFIIKFFDSSHLCSNSLDIFTDGIDKIMSQLITKRWKKLTLSNAND